MLFNNIKGLDFIKNKLIKSYQNQHIAHAQLFLGQEGGANLALALAFAQYIHCENPQDGDACGICSSCIKHKKYIHPDLHFVYPVTTTKKVGSKPLSQYFIKQWREVILESTYINLQDWLDTIGAENKQGNISVEESRQIVQTLALKSFEAEFKILLMWLPEQMNIQAANAILKILEEPPQKTIFLLVCNDEKKLLTTIISRVQLVKIPQFQDEEVKKFLKEKYNLSEDRAEELAYLSDGNLRQAIYLTQNSTNNIHGTFRDWMRACYKKDIIDLVTRGDAFAKLNKENQKNLFSYALGVFRESLVWQSKSDALLRISEDKLKFIEGFNKTLSIDKLERLYKLFNEALYHIERNASAKIMFLDVSLKVSQVFRS